MKGIEARTSSLPPGKDFNQVLAVGINDVAIGVDIEGHYSLFIQVISPSADSLVSSQLRGNNPRVFSPWALFCFNVFCTLMRLPSMKTSLGFCCLAWRDWRLQWSTLHRNTAW